MSALPPPGVVVPPRLAKLETRPVPQICGEVEWSDAVAALISDRLTPPAFLALLIERGLAFDGMRFLAQALPPREAIWWACQCARMTFGATVAPGTAACLAAAEGWVYKPTEESRLAALQAVQGFTGPKDAAAWAAIGASWASTAPPGPETPRGMIGIVGRAVAAAIGTALQAVPTAEFDRHFQAMLAKGIELAAGPPARAG